MLTPGPILYLAYSLILKNWLEISLSLFQQKVNLSVIVATFSFTMLGFLAAVITIIFALSDKKTMVKYKKKKRLDVFFMIYHLAIVCLMVTFFTSIISLSSSAAVWPMRISLMMVVNNFVQIILLTIIIINLAKRSIGEGQT